MLAPESTKVFFETPLVTAVASDQRAALLAHIAACASVCVFGAPEVSPGLRDTGLPTIASVHDAPIGAVSPERTAG